MVRARKEERGNVGVLTLPRLRHARKNGEFKAIAVTLACDWEGQPPKPTYVGLHPYRTSRQHSADIDGAYGSYELLATSR